MKSWLRSNLVSRYREILAAAVSAFLLVGCGHWTDADLPVRLGALHFTPTPGTITDPDPVVSIESPDTGVSIKYTTDGSDPTRVGSTKIYTGPIHLKGKGIVTIQAYATKDGTRSSTARARYLFPVPWESSATVSYGSLVVRGRTYRTVDIGNQTWMAENLNDAGADGKTGVCLHDDTLYCSVYGRLYDWSQANATSPNFNTAKWGGPDRQRQGVCPSGWHIPSRADWGQLVDWVDSATGRETPGNFLKSRWVWTEGNGVDSFGFRMIPASSRQSPWEYSPGKYTAVYESEPGGSAIFWTATETDTVDRARAVNFPGSTGEIMDFRSPKADAMSVRCLRNP